MSLTTLRLKWQALLLNAVLPPEELAEKQSTGENNAGKLQAIEDKYLDLEAKISGHDIIADQKGMAEVY